ncbi:MAG: hypothetical protein MI867_00625, partial [Pseudomonadales bacterium]|nr:hypothetical protein [Pseudomonadales bacterium]
WLKRPGEVITVTGELIEGTDPGLVDFDNGDIRITASSPAVDRAVAVSGLPSVDMQSDGNGSRDSRSISGASMDLGAYEYSTGVVVAPPNPPSNIRITPGS